MDSHFLTLPSTGEITRSQKTECDLEWRIPDFLSLIDSGQRQLYFGPPFSFAGAIWRCDIHVDSGGINAFLSRESSIPPISLEVSFGFKTSKGKIDKELCAERHISEMGHEMYISSTCLRIPTLLKRKSDILPSNVLTILYTLKLQNSTENICEDIGDIAKSKCSFCKDTVDFKDISLHENKCVNKPIKCPKCSDVIVLKNWYEHKCQAAKTQGEPSTPASSNIFHEEKLQQDFKRLFLNKENCDVILKVQGQEFQAHKLILQARSLVLASTFCNDMKEKATGIIEIEDCDPSSFSDFLCFLYCGDMKVISQENVFSLFTTADKYDVQDLRALCLKSMKENLSVVTFCDTITVGLRHSETELVNLTTDFFIMNATEIIKTVKWQSFLDENSTVGNELFLKFASNSSNSRK